MADSNAVRQRRKRLHAAGDHSMCRTCPAVRAGRPLELVTVEPDARVDPVAELQAVAARLVAVHRADPANTPVAHELRLALAELARIGPPSADPLDELRQMMGGVP